MRVLHLGSLYPPYVLGGAERVVELLAEGMAARGIDTAVAHLAPSPTPHTRRNGVAVHPLRHRNPLWIERSALYSSPARHLNKLATLFNFMTRRDFETVLAAYSPDIVHSHSMVELTPSMWDAAKAAGARVVHTLHDYDLLCIRGALFKDGRHCRPAHTACSVFSAVKRRHHRHIDHVVGVSKSILETHLERGFFQDLPGTNRHVVWNPVRSSATHACEPRARADSAGVNAGALEGPLTFGFLGRLVPEKGIGLLLEACRTLPRAGWRLRVAGRAPASDAALREQATGLSVEFEGFVDPREFLRRIDVLIVPSVWDEPFGLTVIEAYAAGVRVLGADSGGIAEIIGAADPQWLVPRSDAEALSARMRELIERGRHGLGPPPDFSAVLRRTFPDHAVDQYLRIYRAALCRPPAQVPDEVPLAS